MTSTRALLDGIANARPRQLLGRIERPLRRRRFPEARAGGRLRAVESAAPLWRSDAFADPPIGADGTRLAHFRSHYGEDVLAAARAGDAAAARGLVRSWLEAHPPRPSDAWHPYTVATRVGNWVAAATLVPALIDSELEQAIARHAARLAANVEQDVLGNHLIRDARGLALAGVALDDGPSLAVARSLLARELPEQILPDGGHYERSPAYHALVLRDLLEVAAATRWPEVTAAADAMRPFAAASLRPDGVPAHFNDGGADVAPDLGLDPPGDGVQVYPASGYAFVRTQHLWLAFDCGEPSPRFLPPHAHGDILSFQLWHDGRMVVADPGTYTYEPGQDRHWFRGTRAHSTISIDGGDQLALWGSFRGSLFPEVAPLEAGDSRVGGTVRWRNGVVHRRRITWTDDAVTVADELLGSGRHVVRSTLPLGSPDVEVAAVGAVAHRESAWLSERFGERVAIENAVVELEAELPVELGWRITLAR
jgi:hypothetical protein